MEQSEPTVNPLACCRSGSFGTALVIHWWNFIEILHVVSYNWTLTQNLTRVSHAENVGQNDPIVSGSYITVQGTSTDEISLRYSM